MKRKCLISLFSLVGVITPTTFLVSCGGDQPDPPVPTEGAEKYIYDRTFSVLERGNIYGSWGTAWIIDDATPENTNDYTYYIATNWHVIHGMHSVMKSKRDTCYAKGTNPLDPLSGYYAFKSFEEEETSNFSFAPSRIYSFESVIDFYVVKANFGDASYLSTTIKQNLDELNDYRSEHGHITDFADIWTKPKSSENIYTYIGGYPVKQSNKATWEYHQIDPNKLESVDKEYIEDGYILAHGVDSDTAPTQRDISPQYLAKYDFGSGWMDGGASGSMLITNINNEWKVLGIYWGGWTNEDQTAHFPGFSIFKSKYKNYIENYLN